MATRRPPRSNPSAQARAQGLPERVRARSVARSRAPPLSPREARAARLPGPRAGLPEAQRQQYTIGDIKHWLSVFAWRFFKLSQFKRSCIPNAPKVGSGGSLSPRGDYRAPSDSEATVWLDQLELIPDADPLHSEPSWQFDGTQMRSS